MKKIFAPIEWILDNVSKPIQIFFYAFIILGLVVAIPLAIKSCGAKPNYEGMDAFFVNEDAPLHDDNYSIKVVDATMKDSISIKSSRDADTLTILDGNFVAVEICITQKVHSEKEHKLDANDFKLKDHTGTIIPLSMIMDAIDVTAPDFRVDRGDSVDSNASFTTVTAIKDYTWIGKQITKEQETILTIYFKVPDELNVHNTIMILEADFFVGVGETASSTDIVLFERKQPIK